MAKKVKAAVNKGANKAASVGNSLGYVLGGLALVAFGVSFVADVVDAVTADDDYAPVLDVAEDVAAIEDTE